MKATQCSIEGCDRTTWTRGICELHYRRLRKSGEIGLLQIPSPAVRLAAGLERKPNGCLEWTGFTSAKGYGVIAVDGKNVRTHRLAWTLTNGPVPDGLFVCHRCDNPPCCDAESHLFLGTPADNVADMDAKGRHASAKSSKTHCPQGHEYAGSNLYVNPNGWRECRTCKKDRDTRPNHN